MSAEVKISEMDSAGTPSGTEYFEIVQDGQNKKIAFSAIEKLGNTWKPVNTYTTSSAPTATKQAATGAGSTLTMHGTNETGILHLGTGTGTGTGEIIDVAFSGGLTYPNGCAVALFAGDTNMSSELSKLYVTTTPTGFKVFARTALTISTAFEIHYIAKGY